MNFTTILLIANVLAAVSIIALVLMQQSKSDMGSAFGGGGSQSMFGSKGSANFLSRCTSTMVTVFFLSSLALAFTYAKRNSAEQEVTPISVEQSSEFPVIEDTSTSSSSTDTDGVPTIEAEQAEVPVLEATSAEETVEEAKQAVETELESAVQEIPATEETP